MPSWLICWAQALRPMYFYLLTVFLIFYAVYLPKGLLRKHLYRY